MPELLFPAYLFSIFHNISPFVFLCNISSNLLWLLWYPWYLLGAIGVISNNKCEWSNVENIIPPPVKVLQGPSRNINGKRPAEGISRRGLHFSWMLEQETFHIPDLTIVSKILRFIRLFHYNIQISKCCSVRPAFPTPNSLLENFSITQVSLIVTWRKLPN